VLGKDKPDQRKSRGGTLARRSQLVDLAELQTASSFIVTPNTTTENNNATTTEEKSPQPPTGAKQSSATDSFCEYSVIIVPESEQTPNVSRDEYLTNAMNRDSEIAPLNITEVEETSNVALDEVPSRRNTTDVTTAESTTPTDEATLNSMEHRANISLELNEPEVAESLKEDVIVV
jgi:hypothetical protein